MGECSASCVQWAGVRKTSVSVCKMCAGEAGGSPRPIVGTVDEGCGGDSTTACVQHVDEQRDVGRVESEEASRHDSRGNSRNHS